MSMVSPARDALLRAVSFDPGRAESVSVGADAGQLPVGCARLAVLRDDQVGGASNGRLRLSRQHTLTHGPREQEHSQAKSNDGYKIRPPANERPAAGANMAKCVHRGYDP